MGGEAERDGVLGKIVEGLSSTPAYLMAFGLVFVMTTSGALLAGKNGWVAALLIAGGFALGGVTIWIVETRRVSVGSREQAERISGLKDREAAIHGVLEGLVDSSREAYFVYSSSLVSEFLTHEGKVNPYPFRDDEKVVTTIRDAWGIAMVHGLLHLGGMTSEGIEIVTAREFTDKCWDTDLILIGSGFANPKTEAALKSFKSPLRFSDDRAQIVGDASGAGEPQLQWPKPGADPGTDYGLVVKLKVVRHGSEKIYLVLAGLGPTGTLAACYYLTENIVGLHDRFKSSPFGLVVRVDKDLGYTSTEEVEGSARFLAPST